MVSFRYQIFYCQTQRRLEALRFVLGLLLGDWHAFNTVDYTIISILNLVASKIIEIIRWHVSLYNKTAPYVRLEIKTLFCYKYFCY